MKTLTKEPGKTFEGRKYPTKLDAMILSHLLGFKSTKTNELYKEKIEKFERSCENSLIETLGRLNIQATVKTDPYSLPYKNEVIVKLQGESYLNGPYELFRVTRQIVKELLDKNVYQLRFYLYIEVETNSKNLFDMGRVVYHFRYFEKI